MQPVAFPERTPADGAVTPTGAAPSKLLMVQLEDPSLCRAAQLPGTVEPVYPNWRLKVRSPWRRGTTALAAGILPALAGEPGSWCPAGWPGEWDGVRL